MRKVGEIWNKHSKNKIRFFLAWKLVNSDMFEFKQFEWSWSTQNDGSISCQRSLGIVVHNTNALSNSALQSLYAMDFINQIFIDWKDNDGNTCITVAKRKKSEEACISILVTYAGQRWQIQSMILFQKEKIQNNSRMISCQYSRYILLHHHQSGNILEVM